MSSEFAKRFLERIREQGGTLLPPASLEDIKQFEQSHGFSLPAVLRKIYLESNGTDPDDYVNRLIPLEELEFMEDARFGQVVAFFEYSLYCRMWWFIVRDERVVEYSSTTAHHSVADSLKEFLELYPNHQMF